MSITLIQTDLFWEDIDRNLDHFSHKMKEVPDHTDVVVLPEMFTTGFSMDSEKLAESTDGKSCQWMLSVASRMNVVLTGSLIIREHGNYYNRLFVIFPEGTCQYYDKRHLFRMNDENRHYTAGKERLIVAWNNWRILPLICYDLRFPVWSRNRGDYDLLVYIASWPEPRREAWKTLLKARALENQAYVAGVNRIGKDGRGIKYAGDSMVVDPNGQVISKTKPYRESVETLVIDLDDLHRVRKDFPVGEDADDFEIK